MKTSPKNIPDWNNYDPISNPISDSIKKSPSQILIKRYSALGDIPLEYFGKNDLGLMESNNYLKQNDNDIIKIHNWDIQLPTTDTNATTSRIKHKLNYLPKGSPLLIMINQKNSYTNLYLKMQQCG